MEATKSRVRVGRLILIVLGAVGLAALLWYAPALFMRYHAEQAPAELQSGGTSAAAFMVDKWKEEYLKQKGVKLRYKSTGSTEGISRVIDKTYPICFTHSPLTAEQMKAAKANGGDMLHIPVAICAVVPIYNIKDLRGKAPINFTREALADIFLGKIKRWNDPALVKINDGVTLPDLPIHVVYREDKSGTNFIFTEYLSGVSDEWDKKIGPASAKVEWPVGAGTQRSVDLVAMVAEKDGAIGYADLLHALSNNKSVSYGAVQNKDRSKFIHAEPDNMTAAAAGLGAAVNDDLTFDLTNKPGADAYPICGGIWAVCYANQPPEAHQLVAEFLTWATHDGQKFTKERTYAPLPDDIVKRVDEKLKLLKAS
jgi:phosphate transport system substrate-binding protein